MGWRLARSSGFAPNFLSAVVLSAIILSLGVLSTPSKAEPQAGQLPNGETAPGKSGRPGVKKDSPAKSGATPTKKDGPAKNATPPAKADAKQTPPVKLGLSINDPRAFQGYTLFCPIESSKTYLIDMQGRVVHTWESDCTPALSPYLLENGHLLRAGSIGQDSRIFGPGPGVGGRIQEFAWTGELVWDFRFYNARQLPHHDITRLPNGNVLLVVSDRKTNEEIIAAGRRPELTGDSHSIPDSLIEIRPTGKTTGEVVWEWHVWDHLVQDFDKTKANYGNVAQHPELVNVNFGEDEQSPAGKNAPAKSQSKGKPAAGPPPNGPSGGKAGSDKPQSKGNAVAAPRPGGRPRGNSDWTHFNAVAYNADLDQIVVSVYAFSEFWIIDHSTTRAEAAGRKGGRSGKGGDLLYRWGNPRAYRAGKKTEQTLFNQHNVHWIAKGLPGVGHLLLFNNGNGRSDGSYSSVDELVLPADSQGRYVCKPGGAYMPPQVVWTYCAPKKPDFYSSFISGTQRLQNGNTLICSGANGTVFEVTPTKDIVWKYVNPVKRGPMEVHPPIQPGKIMTPVARDMLGVSADQCKQLVDLQKNVDAQLQNLLTAAQRKQLAEKSQAPFSKPGEIMASVDQSRLKFTDEQKKKVAALQKEVDDKFEKVLTVAQKKQLKSSLAVGGPPPGPPPPPGGFLSQLKNLFAGAGPAPVNPAMAAPGGSSQAGKILSPGQQEVLKLTPDQTKKLEEFQKDIDAKLDKLLTAEQKTRLKQMQQRTAPAGPVFAGGPGRGGPPPGGSPLFRAQRYSRQYPGLAGKNLTPGKTIEELQQTPQKKEIVRKN